MWKTNISSFGISFINIYFQHLQCPDLELSELRGILSSGEYSLLSAHIQNFEKKLLEAHQRGVASILDLIQSLGRLMVEPSHMAPPIVHKSSVIGEYFGYRSYILMLPVLVNTKNSYSQRICECETLG